MTRAGAVPPAHFMKHKLHLVLWQAKDGWRWHAVRNGKIVAESGESYKRKGGAVKTLKAIIAAIQAGDFALEVP
jgi:hypothetical protein